MCIRDRQITSLNGVPYPDAIGIAPRHPSRAGWRASWIHMEVVELQTLPTQLINIWSLNDGIAITTKITVALIVRHHQDNIWSLRGRVYRTDHSDQGKYDNFELIHS